MKIHNVEQNSEEWYKLRLGKFTGSNFHICMGKEGTKGRKDLILSKAAEKITGMLSDQNFSTIHIRRGHELEPDARNLYELSTYYKVEEVGFCELDEHTGCSPDGLINDDGMIEIKCKDNHTYLSSMASKKIEPMHKTQIQFNLMVTGRRWCDYVLYNANFDKSIFVQRVYRDNEGISEIKIKLQACINEMDIIIEDYKND